MSSGVAGGKAAELCQTAIACVQDKIASPELCEAAVQYSQQIHLALRRRLGDLVQKQDPPGAVAMRVRENRGCGPFDEVAAAERDSAQIAGLHL